MGGQELISSTFYVRVFRTKFWRQKLQSWKVTRESCAITFCTKKARIKCWWNWHQTYFCSLAKFKRIFEGTIKTLLPVKLYLKAWQDEFLRPLVKSKSSVKFCLVYFSGLEIHFANFFNFFNKSSGFVQRLRNFAPSRTSEGNGRLGQ